MKGSTSSRGRRPHLIGMTVVGVTGLLFVAFVAIRWCAFDYVRVPTESMFPTIAKGSLVIVDKRGFGNLGPLYEWKRVPTAKLERGDLVLFFVGEDSRTSLKRTIGLPGDRIALKNRQLTINGAAVPLEFSPGPPVTSGRFQYQLASETIDGRKVNVAWLPERPSRDFEAVVPEGHYFVLGDNRDNSLDSRYPDPGFIASKRIVGKVMKVFAPD